MKPSGRMYACLLPSLLSLLLILSAVPPSAAGRHRTAADNPDDTEIVTGVRLTPRFWVSAVNPVDGEGESKEQYVLPFFGGTVLVSPSATPNTNYLLTGLYGEGEGEYLLLGSALGESTMKRFDLELLIRRNFPGKGLSLFFGPRFIGFEESNVAASFQAETTTDMVIVEFGLGSVTDITENGQHRVFANFVPGIANVSWDYEDNDGVTDSDSSIRPTLDLNLGYQLGLGDRAALSARYRGFFVSDENDYEQSRLVTVHGPEFALSVGL